MSDPHVCMHKTLVLYGAGRMGQALLSGWLRSFQNLTISIIDLAPSSEINALAKAGRIKLNPPPSSHDYLILAVKPQVFETIASDVEDWIDENSLVISIMAGVKLAKLRKTFKTAPLIRVMPNTPGAIGQGANVFTHLDANPNLDKPQCKALFTQAQMLMGALGETYGPIDELNMGTVTAVSGCGPAYLFLLCEMMEQAAISHGLAPDLAKLLARQTLIGAGALLEKSNEPIDILRKAVTSPGGVTEAALKVLTEDKAMPALMHDTFAAAIERDKALS